MRQLIFITENDLPKHQVFGRDLPLQQYQKYLGTSRPTDLFYDARQGLYPNAFTALAGTLTHHHNLYLYLPEHYPNGDPDHQRLLDYGENIENCHSYYNQRLRKLNKISSPSSTSVSKTTRHSFTHSKPQVFLGGRGRGKSTQLNEKIQWLDKHHHTPILLITPYRSNQQPFTHFPSNLMTLPPDEALRRRPKAAHLMIDEAAAIPPVQLCTLINHYPCYTLATTTEGYEGSANTFLTKTLPSLGLEPENIIFLTTSYRYQSEDALERLINRLTLHVTHDYPENMQPITFHHQQPSDFFHNESALQQLWSLLSHAHYRTRPEDLKRLLDLPNQHLFLAKSGPQILAACHILIETPLSRQLAKAIIDRKRRPRGRLLMQQLLIHSQQIDYANQPLARIQRIVTAKNHRRQHLASQLLSDAQQVLKIPIGTVHTSDAAINQFWETQGFMARYQSNTQRTRHHAHTIIRLRSFS